MSTLEDPQLCPLLLACWYGAINRFAELEIVIGQPDASGALLSPTSRGRCRLQVSFCRLEIIPLFVNCCSINYLTVYPAWHDWRARRFGKRCCAGFLDEQLRTGFRPIFGLSLTAYYAASCIAEQDYLAFSYHGFETESFLGGAGA